MPRRSLAERRFVITGASSGLGAALAKALVAYRPRLVLTARRGDRLESLAAELRTQGAQATCVAGDIASPEIRAAVVEAAVREFGGLDVLVNNAGVGALGRFENSASERLRQIFEVNFFALVELTRTALPILKQGNQPLIVNVGSILGRRGIPRMSEYCASKFAVQGFSESLRAEVAADGLGVLVVNPGTSETEFQASVIERRGETPWPQRPGTPAAVVARAMIRAMQAGKHEIVPSFSGRLLVWLNRVSPRLADAFLARYG